GLQSRLAKHLEPARDALRARARDERRSERRRARPPRRIPEQAPARRLRNPDARRTHRHLPGEAPPARPAPGPPHGGGQSARPRLGRPRLPRPAADPATPSPLRGGVLHATSPTEPVVARVTSRARLAAYPNS